MKRLTNVMLGVILACGVMAGTPGCGANHPLLPTPVVVAPTTPSNVWAETKAGYHSALILFTEYAKRTCPNAVCPPDADPREVNAIREAQKVHAKALVVIAAGDGVVDGDYTAVVAALKELTDELKAAILK